MKHIQRGTIALAAVALCGLAAQLPAQALPDTTPPKLHTPLKAHFVVGTQLDQFQTGGEYFYHVPEQVDWSGSDNSGDIYYSVWEYYAGDDPSQLIDFTQDTSAQVTTSDYEDQFGGGSFATENWSVQAHDFNSNSIERYVGGAHLLVTQDDGYQTIGKETTDVAISYNGSWTTAHCACFAEGTTHKSTTAGDAAIIKVNVPASEGVRKVAIVMETAPNRGRARVLVDGTLNKTIDTRADTATHQVVVWRGSLATGSHTIRLVNQGTAGRLRIDLDAVVVN
jgi:hypothetical protein